LRGAQKASPAEGPGAADLFAAQYSQKRSKNNDLFTIRVIDFSPARADLFRIMR
jgi:hypothetical protein